MSEVIEWSVDAPHRCWRIIPGVTFCQKWSQMSITAVYACMHTHARTHRRIGWWILLSACSGNVCILFCCRSICHCFGIRYWNQCQCDWKTGKGIFPRSFEAGWSWTGQSCHDRRCTFVLYVSCGVSLALAADVATNTTAMHQIKQTNETIL